MGSLRAYGPSDGLSYRLAEVVGQKEESEEELEEEKIWLHSRIRVYAKRNNNVSLRLRLRGSVFRYDKV